MDNLNHYLDFKKTKRFGNDQLKIIYRGNTEDKLIEGESVPVRLIVDFKKTSGRLGFGLQNSLGDLYVFM